MVGLRTFRQCRDNACFAAPLHGMKKIAVGFKSLYNVVTESWEIVEGLDGFTGEAPVTVGNTMYGSGAQNTQAVVYVPMISIK